jgi:hypothetical protein
MSWFRKTPNLKRTEKHLPQRSSQVAEKLWKETVSKYHTEKDNLNPDKNKKGAD